MLLKDIKGPDVELALNELYDTRYGILTHNDPKRPLSSVAFSELEDSVTDSVMIDAIRNYLYKDIYTLFGLNLIEFMNLPVDICEVLIDLATEKQAEKLKMIKKQENELVKDGLLNKK